LENKQETLIQQKIECSGKQIWIDHDRYYTHNHIWVKITSKGNLKIGISDYVHALLETSVIIFDKTKGSVEKGEQFCTLYGRRCNYQNFDVISPIKGKIIEVNKEIMSKPQLLNYDCYDKGWIVIIEPATHSWKSIHNLITGSEYIKFLHEGQENQLRVFSARTKPKDFIQKREYYKAGLRN
jgi:glycine cleavage system H protein